MRGIRSTTRLGAALAATTLGATLAGPAQAQPPAPAVSVRVLPAGADFSSPAEILENGVAVGTEGSFAFGLEVTEGARPWIWTGRQRHLLPIGTAAAGWVVDAAEPGLIVGDVLRPDPATGTTRRHAVAWRPSGVADLAPGAAGDTGAVSVNRRGDVLIDAEGVALVARDGGRTVVTGDASAAGVSVNDRRDVLYRRAYAGGGQGMNYWRGDGTDVSVASTVPQWGNPLCFAGVTKTGWMAASFVSFGPTYNLRLRHRSGDTFALQAPAGSTEPQRAVLWRRGGAVVLDEAVDGVWSQAVALNDRDDVLVRVDTNDLALWRDGRRIPLPVPDGFHGVAGIDLNNRGEILGRADRYDARGRPIQSRPVIWTVR